MLGSGQQQYRCADMALMRAGACGVLTLPDWPDTPIETHTHVKVWLTWLREAWKCDAIADGVGHASPALARQVRAVLADEGADVRQMRRIALSTARYVLRMTGRSTPFGLFAGVCRASFGPESAVRIGLEHRAVARADASWLTPIIAQLEQSGDLLGRLPVVVNNASFVRGDRFVVPDAPRAEGADVPASAEVSVRYTSAVRITVGQARTPIRFDALIDKLASEFPTAPAGRIRVMLADLVKQRVLITSLHAPSGVSDALSHLVGELKSAGADGVPDVVSLFKELCEIHATLALHNVGEAATVRSVRAAVTEKMTALLPASRYPLAVDLRLDASVVLPHQVAREAQAAAAVLARLSAYPFGTPAWKDYFTRFFARYGVGSAVRLRDVVDPDVGLGFPAGYLGSGPEPRDAISARHLRLLALAQTAALDGRREIELDERLVNELGTAEPGTVRIPPHMELCFHVQSPTVDALGRGDFELVVVGASRAAGTMSGRFLDLLEPPDTRAITALDHLTEADPEALAVQVSFPPLDPRQAHVVRAPEVLPAVVSVAEHRVPDSRTIALDDLAVMCDKDRLYLVSLSRRRRLIPSVLHALELRGHTPPLVRFLVEVARAQTAAVTTFDWGPAARLPYLPRLRYGRTIVSPAHWRLEQTDFPGRGASWPSWCEAVMGLRGRRRMPAVVYLVEGDQRLKLDLDEPAHLALLRDHTTRTEALTLTEAPTGASQGWIGGRPHEVVTTLTAVRQPVPTARPKTVRTVIGRDHGCLPGSPPWLHAKLYGAPDRIPHLLTRHLPDLLAAWDTPPRWWYTRFRDPQWHLRLRIAVPREADFAVVAQRVNTWANALRSEGLLSGLELTAGYPETGRWGSGTLLDSAEDVFVADSAALAVQFSTPDRPHFHVLAAAHFVAMSIDFSGNVQTGMAWLLEHARADSSPVDRDMLKTTVRLADPADGWAALKSVPGGPAIVGGWAPRTRALARYREALLPRQGMDRDAVLDSLLHAHYLRAAGVDPEGEATCRRLARAAALSWHARLSQREGR